MAFSFRTGINWYHDFPKLARDSGFYFNMHKNKVRIDWNRIAGIDIERVIQDRNFLIIDENINSIIDYNLDSEYDVKILDPNFVKLFRLAQLAVEYLLYCKQYLDHSVVILKDELRSKMEENVKLKKELTLADEDLSLLKDKLKNKFKICEKLYSENPKDLYKCPYCKKTFVSAVCTSYHIGRRHSNSSQFSSASPVHEQSKTEKEKLQDEIKNLKERLNQTERVINNESEKSPRNIKLNEKTYENQTTDIQSNEINKDKVLEEVHKKYQEEINNLKAIVFNEIKNMREDEKKFNQLDNENENLKELLKQQENEIHQLTDQIQELSSKQSAPNLEMIQLKLIDQEEYWKSKIDQMESQHTKDIEELSMQLRMTQEIAERMRNDYMINLKKLEEKSKHCNENVHSLTKSPITPRPYEEDELHEKHSISDKKEKNRKFSDKKYKSIDEKDKISANSTEDSSEKMENDLSNLHHQRHLKSNDLDSQEKHLLNETKLKSQSNHKKVLPDEQKIDYTLSKQHHRIRKNSIKKMNMKTDVSSSQSDVSESESEILSKSEDSEESQSTENQDFSSQGHTESDQDKFVQNKTSTRKMENFKQEVLSGLEQKLLDLGVDIEMDGIPKPTYQRLITIVKHHRNISNKKYQDLEEIRRSIIHKINKKIFSQDKRKKKLQVYNTPKRLQLKKSINNDKLKMDSSSEVKIRSNTPKIKFEKTSFVKHFLDENNQELLPMKMTHQKFQELNTARSKLLNSKKDEYNRDRLSSNNRKKSSSPQVVYIDSMQQENVNSKQFRSLRKNENTNKFIGNENHNSIFSPKSLKSNDNDKDEVDILSINDDDDENQTSSHHHVINRHKELTKFPQPAPRITKENLLETL